MFCLVSNSLGNCCQVSMLLQDCHSSHLDTNRDSDTDNSRGNV